MDMTQRRTYALPVTPAVQIDSFEDHVDNTPPPSSPYLAVNTTPVPDDYPPRAHHGSSPHLPLLADQDSDHDQPLAWMQTTKPSMLKASLFSSRTRVHPLSLIPACLLGVLLSMSGFFGNSARSHSHKSNNPLAHASRAGYVSHPSGHLFVNPASIRYPNSPFEESAPPRPIRHPIHDLVANATREWEAKLARQSKTLEQAVEEYKRRHRRNPPKGFDDWFRFAQANDVVLIDEFDNIYRDVLPFWALPSEVVNSRAADLQDAPWTFSMIVEQGEVEVVGAHRHDGRAKDQKDLMKRWAKWVPDVNITMSAHDGPSIMIDYETRQKHIDAANDGRLLGKEIYDSVSDSVAWGFQGACPPDSRLGRWYSGLETAALPLGPSFVQDHIQTMDMCSNPEWKYLHGFTAWAGMPPKPMLPIFSFAKTSVYSDLLLTPLEQYWDHEPWDPEWNNKPHNKAIWRGSTTGVWFDRTTWWRSSQRVRLWFMSKDKSGVQKVRFDGSGVESKSGTETIAEREVPTSALMNRYVDFAFSGKVGQCNEEDGSCAAVEKLIDFQPALGWNQANEFKYLLDIDGNAWSGRFHRLLSSNSAVIKSTIFPEWYSGWIQPWVHYIPVKVDYTDLFDVLAFFSGDLDGNNGHEDMARAIARQGQEYTAKYWRYQDMETYFFRLALEWARVTAEDRELMDYTGPGT